MEVLPTEPGAKLLVFGRGDSGKSTFAIEYASEVLRNRASGVCLVLAQKTKTERKPVRIDDVSISDRILFKWVHDRVSLIDACSQLHEFAGQPLELLIVEDLGDLLPPGPACISTIVSLLSNAVSVFPGARLLVTLTPKSEIVGFRFLMTHYVNTCGEKTRISVFPKSLSRANEAIRSCLGI